ncbi:MAG: hypothetical protein DRO18_02665 [Thermoprotei archaeon]|nr:MAG: hypothetical protein DRO18_02665 [Thermoprotei archaeon]
MVSPKGVKLPLILFPGPHTDNLIRIFKENPNYPLFKKPYGPVATYLWSYVLSCMSKRGKNVKLLKDSIEFKAGSLLHDLLFGELDRITDSEVLKFINALSMELVKKYANSPLMYVIDSETIFDVKRRFSRRKPKKKGLLKVVKGIFSIR